MKFVRRGQALQWGLLAVVGTVLVAIGEDRNDALDWLLLTAGATFIVGPQLWAERRVRSAAGAAIDMQTELTLTVGKAITPIAGLVGRIALASETERLALQMQLWEKVVGAAANLCGPPDQTRATFFRLQNRTLVPRAWQGGDNEPRTVFVKGRDPAGRCAHALVEGRDVLLVKDIETADPDLQMRPESPYRTSLNISVYAGDQSFGMLSIDAVVPGTLDETDVSRARALAQLLGAGLAIGSKNC